MFAGHVGAAFAVARIERRINVATFIFYALLLDVLLWLLILTGAESVSFPADFAATHQPLFDFPYSHGLLGSLAWSLLAGVFAYGAYWPYRDARARVAVLLALLVFSHFVLDFIVHRPEMPLAGRSSMLLGAGLYLHSLPGALVLEAALALGGLALFLQGSSLPRRKKLGLAALVLTLTAFTLAGMLFAAEPPSPFAMAGSSLGLILFVCLLARRLGKPDAPAAKEAA